MGSEEILRHIRNIEKRRKKREYPFFCTAFRNPAKSCLGIPYLRRGEIRTAELFDSSYDLRMFETQGRRFNDWKNWIYSIARLIAEKLWFYIQQCRSNYHLFEAVSHNYSMTPNPKIINPSSSLFNHFLSAK